MLIATLGWRAIFFINVPVALIAIGLTLRYAGETSHSRDRGVDVAGQVLAVVTLTALVAATIEGGARGFGSPLVLAGFALAALRARSSWWSRRAARARCCRWGCSGSATFSVPAAIGLLINIAFYGLIFVFSLLFQREQGLTPLQTGLALAPIMSGSRSPTWSPDASTSAVGPAADGRGGDRRRRRSPARPAGVSRRPATWRWSSS